jgi:hypothetical protein
VTLTAVQRLEVFSNGNPAPEQTAAVRAAHARLKDSDPRDLSPEDLASIGHERRPLLAVIRENCIQCTGGYVAEVRRCQCTGCLFWPLRMNADPFRPKRRLSEAQKEALNRGRLAASAGYYPDGSEAEAGEDVWMPETAFPPSGAVPAAATRQTGPGWDATSGRVAEARDPVSHLPLGGVLPPGTTGTLAFPEPAPPPPAPSETELRQRLATAIETTAKAEAAMEAARTAHERALFHQRTCTSRAAEFATLAARIDGFVMAALKTTGRPDLPDEIVAQINDRARAETELEAARRAVTILLGEMANAIERHKQAENAQRIALHAVLDVGRDKLREAMAPAEAKVASFKQIIGAGSHFGPWPEVIERVMADPLNASLDVSVGDEPLPSEPVPIPPPIGPVMVRFAKQIGHEAEPDVLVPLEVATRMRAQPAPPQNAAMAELEARERAAKQARGI